MNAKSQAQHVITKFATGRGAQAKVARILGWEVRKVTYAVKLGHFHTGDYPHILARAQEQGVALTPEDFVAHLSEDFVAHLSHDPA